MTESLAEESSGCLPALCLARSTNFDILISEMCSMENRSNVIRKMKCYELFLAFDNCRVGCVTIYRTTTRIAVVLDLSVPQIHRSCRRGIIDFEACDDIELLTLNECERWSGVGHVASFSDVPLKILRSNLQTTTTTSGPAPATAFVLEVEKIVL